MPALKDSLRNLLPRVRELAAAPVIWLPGHRFVCDRVEAPKELKSQELEDLVALHTEENSPFPPESTAWGYYRPSPNVPLLTYAAWREGLQLGPNVSYAEHVLPGFLPGCARLPESPCLRFFANGDSLSLLVFDSAGQPPAHIETLKLATDEEAEEETPDRVSELFTVRNKLLATLPAQWRGLEQEPGILEAGEPHVDPEGPLTVELTRRIGPDAGAESLPPVVIGPREALWQADIREKHFLHEERKKRRAQARMWQAMQVAGVAAALCLLAQIALIGGRMLQDAREETLALRMIEANAVEAKEAQLNNLRSFSLAPFRPFEMLALLNRDLRPDTLYFKEISASEEGNRMNVQGIASSINEVNRYEQALVDSGFFESVEIGNRSSRPGQVSFTLELNFKPLVDKNARTEHTAANESVPAVDEDVATPEPLARNP